MRRRRWLIILLTLLLLVAVTGWVGRGYALNSRHASLQLAWRTRPVTADANLTPASGGHGHGQGVVLTHRDLRSQQITDWQALLNGNIMWDTATLWPSTLPSGFDPQRILELGKDPGLGLRQLHAQGITGKGVRVAFLDRPLSLGHKEFGPNVSYMHIGYPARAEMHGAACASLVAGRTVGAAPEAELTYYGVQYSIRSLVPMAAALERILDENLNLPPAKRIRAVGSSQQITPDVPGYDRMVKAITRAKTEGLFFIWTDSPDYKVLGLDRDPLGDPNDPNTYQPGIWLRKLYYEGRIGDRPLVGVPMDSRTVAAETGPEDYRYDREGGFSWAMPWVVGLYALAAQVKPAITPSEFWQAVQETGTYRTITYEGKEFKVGPIASPQALVARLRK